LDFSLSAEQPAEYFAQRLDRSARVRRAFKRLLRDVAGAQSIV